MIASISGTVSRVGLADTVIAVGGLGYLVNVTTKTALELSLGLEVNFHTAHIIREDAQFLFGFHSEDELVAFNLLLSVSGVGPKSALSVIGSLGVDGLSKAVASADDAMFRSVSGIGPKTAKLIVLSLTGKIIAPEGSGAHVSGAVISVTSALVGLGYQERTARSTVEETALANTEANEQELLRLALSRLSNARKVTSDE